MDCKHIVSKEKVDNTIRAKTVDEFKLQFKELLNVAKEPSGIVYVMNTESPIPRLKGESPAIYIGKAMGSLYDRYIGEVSYEAKEYWTRYKHIINTYGPLSFDVYITKNPEVTENNFLHQYHSMHLELPPINLRSYRSSLL